LRYKFANNMDLFKGKSYDFFLFVKRRNDKPMKTHIQTRGIEVWTSVMASNTSNFSISISWVRIYGYLIITFNKILIKHYIYTIFIDIKFIFFIKIVKILLLIWALSNVETSKKHQWPGYCEYKKNMCVYVNTTIFILVTIL
jgi:hypothetical protein